MNAQTRLLIYAPHSLTAYQETGLQILTEHGPLGARDWGRLVHAAQGRHSPEQFCQHCEDAGLKLGKALRRKERVKRRYRNSSRGKAGWYAVDSRGREIRRAEAEEFEWPPGF